LRKPAELLVGPNCLGVLAPGSRLNASFAASMPMAGELALISQSGAIAAGMVDWAAQRHVGFSAIASIGDQLDVDFGDLLDYFALFALRGRSCSISNRSRMRASSCRRRALPPGSSRSSSSRPADAAPAGAVESA
jgi:hypothetical protein